MGFFKDVAKALVLVAICSGAYICISQVYNGYISKEIEVKLKASMAENFRTSERFKSYHMGIVDVTSINTGVNQYQSMVTVEWKGDKYTVMAHVLSDGNKFIWRVDPGEFGFLAQESMNDSDR